jgi:hypothetical protein
VVSLFERVSKLLITLDEPEDHGWNSDRSAVWSGILFPEEVSEILINEVKEERNNDNISSDETRDFESESECDDIDNDDDDDLRPPQRTSLVSQSIF